MSTINFHTIEQALRIGVPKDCKITFDDVEVSLDGIQYEIEVTTEVSVDGGGTEYSSNYTEIELCGDYTKDVRIPLSDVVVGIEDAGLESELLGTLLRAMEEEDFISLFHAIASVRVSQTDADYAQARDGEQSAVCGNNSEQVVAAQAHLDECRTKRLYWQRIHSAVTGPTPEPEPETEPEPEPRSEAAGDAPDPDVSMTATELVEDAMDQRSIAQERADDAAAMPASAATRRALGLLTRGTKFWAFTNDYSLPFIYDERVPAETWGRGLTDDTEVWIEELAPAPEADDPTPDMVLTPDDLSSARYLAMALIRNDHQRPMLIGILVEAGYAVGKQVS